MSGLLIGTTFNDGGTYTAADVNNAVNLATPQPSFITQWSTVAPAATDTLLISDASDSGNLKQATVSSVADYVSTTSSRYSVSTGVANTYAVTLSPAPTAYTTGMRMDVKWNASNTGASTVNVNSLGAKNIFYRGAAIAQGTILTDLVSSVVYDGTQFNIEDAGVPDGSITSTQVGAGGISASNLASNAIIRGMMNGRLTMTTLVPVLTSDVASATSLFFTPYGGNNVSLYDGTNWKLYSFSELTLSLTGLITATMYDVFLYDNASVLTLEALAWTNTTTRATALVLQDGVPVKSGQLTRRYLGSFYTTATGTTRMLFGGVGAGGTAGEINLWNYYNRKPWSAFSGDSADSWTYATAAWRAANNSATIRTTFVQGLNEDTFSATYTSRCSNNAGSSSGVSIGLDSTTVAQAQRTGLYVPGASGSATGTVIYKGYPGIGLHFLSALEYGGGAVSGTYYGDSGSAWEQTGIRVEGWF